MPSIATVLKQKALQSYGGAPSIAAVLSGKLFKVTRREFTTLSGLQHMELYIGEFFLHSLCYCIL